jgi:hypothetical protein
MRGAHHAIEHWQARQMRRLLCALCGIRIQRAQVARRDSALRAAEAATDGARDAAAQAAARAAVVHDGVQRQRCGKGADKEAEAQQEEQIEEQGVASIGVCMQTSVRNSDSVLTSGHPNASQKAH